MVTQELFRGSVVPADVSRRSALLYVAVPILFGLLASWIAGCLLSRSAESHSFSLTALFVTSVIYVSAVCLSGVAGACFFWTPSLTAFRSGSSLSLSMFALTGAAGWVWIPSLVLLYRQDSNAVAPIAAIGAAILATGLRKVMPSAAAPFPHTALPLESSERELFAASLQTPPHSVHAYLLSIGIYAAFFELHNNSALVASALLALCAFSFAWQLTLAEESTVQRNRSKTRAVVRLARVALPAVLITMAVLLLAYRGPNGASATGAAFARGAGFSSNREQRPHSVAQTVGIPVYESIILWPLSEKKQIVAPLPAPTVFLASVTAKPLLIRFDGEYWYFQAPENRPGPNAHVAHGNPSALNIQSTNFIPLTMEAHQNFAPAIRLASCREIHVTIDNRDSRPGIINVALLLTDSTSRGKPTLYLGQQPVVTGQTYLNSAAVLQTLRFPISASGNIRKFDEITVMFLPDGAHFGAGPKIAIREFQLLPR